MTTEVTYLFRCFNRSIGCLFAADSSFFLLDAQAARVFYVSNVCINLIINNVSTCTSFFFWGGGRGVDIFIVFYLIFSCNSKVYGRTKIKISYISGHKLLVEYISGRRSRIQLLKLQKTLGVSILLNQTVRNHWNYRSKFSIESKRFHLPCDRNFDYCLAK